MTPRTFLRTSFKVLLGLLALVLVAGAALSWNGVRKMNRVVTLDVVPVAYVSDAQSVERGRYLYMARGCASCHGENGEGKVFIDDPMGLYARGSNLTTGRGGAVRDYTERDWVRSIRHGVGPSGRALFPMPSEDYNHINDEDLADIVAYTRSLSPKDSEGALVRLPLPVKIGFGIGLIKDSAEKIDHTRPPSPVHKNAATVEHGRYLVRGCVGCHGHGLKGGRIPGGPPDWPAAANITSGIGGVMERYENAEQFKAMMRTAVRPDGTQVDPVMPIKSIKHTNDIDLEAMYLFLKSTESAHSRF